MKKKIIFIPLIAIGGVVVLVGAALGVLNIAKFGIYKDYYHIEEKVAKLPPFGDGYVEQGTSVLDDNGKDLYVTCGYMSNNKSASRVYVVDSDNNRKFIELKNPDGSNFMGHTGGISCNANGITYLASGDSVYEIPSSVLLSSDVKEFKLEVEHKLNHSCSAISSIGEYVWVAEFHGHEYVCEHECSTCEGTNHAVAVKYAVSDFSKPLEVFSIRDEVQGMCVNPDNGDIILSCSYGLKHSHYYVYNTSNVEVLEGKTLFDCPVKALVNPYKDVKAPAMSEDLEFYKGKVYTAQEAGSKKYIFGIFFGDKYIHALDFWKAE